MNVRSFAALVLGVSCLWGCAIEGARTPEEAARQKAEREAYLWQLLYTEAPEFRKAELELYSQVLEVEGRRPLAHPGDADLIVAKWRYVRDGKEVYRFVELVRSRDKDGKLLPIDLTTGRERSTNLITEQTYVPVHKR